MGISEGLYLAGIKAQGKASDPHLHQKTGSTLMKTRCCISGNQENYKVKKQHNQDRSKGKGDFEEPNIVKLLL